MIASVVLALALCAGDAPAMTAPPASAAAADAPAEGPALPEPPGPDVDLDVPTLKVQKLAIDAQNLKARLDVDARVSRVVELTAGIHAEVGGLKMQLEGVESSTRLVVRLDRVTAILDRALGVVEQRPELAAGPVSASPAPAAPAAATLHADSAVEPRAPTALPPSNTKE